MLPRALIARAVALLVSLGVAHAAHAQTSEDAARAKALFKQGVADYEAGRYAQALDAFQEAYRQKPHPLVRVNIANCYDRLDRPVEAIFHFEQFLESKQGSATQRQEIEAAVAALRRRVGKLLLNLTPDGSRVTIDGADERTSPIAAPIVLRAGSHSLRITQDGYDPIARTVEVKSESTTELSLRLSRAGVATAASVAPIAEPEPAPDDGAEEPAAADAPQEAPEPTPEHPEPTPAQPEPIAGDDHEEPSPGIPAAVWIAGGGALLLSGAATVTGLLALSARDNFDENLTARYDQRLTSAQQAQARDNAMRAADRASALAITTDVLIGAAVVSAGIAIYVLVTRDGETEPDVALTPGIGGAVLAGRF